VAIVVRMTSDAFGGRITETARLMARCALRVCMLSEQRKLSEAVIEAN
jgi:hypothetical protein